MPKHTLNSFVETEITRVARCPHSTRNALCEVKRNENGRGHVLLMRSPVHAHTPFLHSFHSGHVLPHVPSRARFVPFFKKKIFNFLTSFVFFVFTVNGNISLRAPLACFFCSRTAGRSARSRRVSPYYPRGSPVVSGYFYILLFISELPA